MILVWVLTIQILALTIQLIDGELAVVAVKVKQRKDICFKKIKVGLRNLILLAGAVVSTAKSEKRFLKIMI